MTPNWFSVANCWNKHMKWAHFGTLCPACLTAEVLCGLTIWVKAFITLEQVSPSLIAQRAGSVCEVQLQQTLSFKLKKKCSLNVITADFLFLLHKAHSSNSANPKEVRTTLVSVISFPNSKAPWLCHTFPPQPAFSTGGFPVYTEELVQTPIVSSGSSTFF